jgi:hypothetical protein
MAAKKHKNKNCRICNFNVLRWTKIEILTFYNFIKVVK